MHSVYLTTLSVILTLNYEPGDASNKILKSTTSVETASCVKWAHAIPMNDTKLNAPIAMTMNDVGLGVCFQRCSRDPDCMSFNYDAIREVCELLSTYRCNGAFSFVASPGYKYYDISCEQDKTVYLLLFIYSFVVVVVLFKTVLFITATAIHFVSPSFLIGMIDRWHYLNIC